VGTLIGGKVLTGVMKPGMKFKIGPVEATA